MSATKLFPSPPLSPPIFSTSQFVYSSNLTGSADTVIIGDQKLPGFSADAFDVCMTLSVAIISCTESEQSVLFFPACSSSPFLEKISYIQLINQK